MDSKHAPGDAVSGIEGMDGASIASCCAAAYQSEWARLLLGESFHPGGLAMTERLGLLLRLGPGMRVLDVAAGQGTSAIYLAHHFGCEVTGLEYGSASVERARAAADAAGVGHLARFEQGNAAHLPFVDAAFDALICECAFCIFSDKPSVAREFARVLRPGGVVGLSDLTRTGEDVPAGLDSLFAWIACIAAAQPVAVYTNELTGAGLRVDVVEAHDEALAELVRQMRTRLLGAELLVKTQQVALPGADFAQARLVARAAAEAVRDGLFGYVVIAARKPR